jgi:regulator of cell morphogenesis and NO signaling
MFLQPFEINRKALVSEIVAQDYRTADVFRKHGIGYCCGGKWPLDIACEMNGVDADKLQAELETATRVINISSSLNYSEWEPDFLMSYLVNVHHHYLKVTLPQTKELLGDFVAEHTKKFPYLPELEKQFDLLVRKLPATMQREEEIIFPYIRQIVYAHKHKEPYAALLVRTLRKPVEETMLKSQDAVSDIVLSIRNLTNSYTTPENACTSHKVVNAKLKELDNDLMQHSYLEQSILFPRAIAIEKEVLSR